MRVKIGLVEERLAYSRKTFAAAACSWIDSKTGLPEVDILTITEDSVSRSFLVGNKGYRFCNFMEVWFEADSRRTGLSGRGFTPMSGIYRGPSFLGIPSHAFLSQTEIFDEHNAVRFTQVVGARTVSPEVGGTGGGLIVGMVAGGMVGSALPVLGTALGAIAGGVVGAFAGEVALHQKVGFPPIWSKIQIRVYKDGRTEAELLQHSIFPSLTFYKQAADPIRVDYFERASQAGEIKYYDANKNVHLPDWQNRGWGPMLAGMSAPGAWGGNPWGITKGVTGGSENLPNR